MMQALHQFHFLRPLWLLALLGLPFAAWPLWRADGALRELSRLVDSSLLPHLLSGRPASRRLPAILLATGWLLATLAFAGPTWSRQSSPLYTERAAQVVAISLSQRMLSKDVAPSRLDRAKYKARELFESNRDGQNALIAYAGEAYVVAPLTSDASSLDELLDALAPDTMPTEGDNAAQAITRGVKLIEQAKAGGGSLVLIADRVDAGAVAAARAARAQGVRVSVLGIGTTQGGPVPLGDGGFLHDGQGHLELARRDDRGLAAVAAAGGGRYLPASNDHSDIDALHVQLRIGGETRSGDQRSEQWQDRGPWLLLPLLLIVALAFRRGWMLMLLVACLPLMSAPAHADGWKDWWLRPDQQAARALQHGDATAARKVARTPEWKAAAAYRAGDYAAAAQSLQPLAGSDDQYNLGNALAKAKQYQQAIAAYDRALQADPGNADAKANRQAVEDWLKRQQQNKNGDSGAKDKDHQGKDSADGKQDGQSSQGKSSSDGKPKPGEGGQGQSGKQGQSSDKQQGQDAKDSSGKPQPGESDGKPQTPEQQAAEKARAEQARKALQQQMDKALAQKGDAGKQAKEGTHQLGLPDSHDPESHLPAEVRQALQRVPDDPGALLRRKFELEYRQRHGGMPMEDDQP